MATKTMRGKNIQVKIALIGLVGTFLTVMGTILVAAVNNWKFTPQPPSLSQNITQPISSATIEPPDVETPLVEAPQDYSIPGEDWEHDCIGSAWNTFPNGVFSRDQNGCLQQPLPRVISVQSGSLSLLSQTSADSAQIYGIFTPISLQSDIEMHLTLNRIRTGQIWIGIMGDADPLKSPGVMLILSEGNVQNQVFVVREMPQNHEVLRSPSIPAEAGGYDVDLVIHNGSVIFKINSLQTPPFPLPFTNRQLFIGYRDQFGANWLDAQISDLKISGN
jgi:hypothetical protein